MAKSPAAVKHGLELDMADDNDQKLYYRAVSRFTAKGELFDLAPERLLTFIEKLSQRAKEFGWSTDIVGIMFIPEDPLGAPTEMDNLLENYGSISMARIRAFEETYITTGTRVGQDTDMLYHCLMASLTEQAIGTLLLKKHEYTVNGEPSGNLLLRLIIRESSLDSNASSTIIRTKLSKLDEYMPVVKSDIKKFNTYVDTQIHALTARSETTSDLLVHLFAAYNCNVKTVSTGKLSGRRFWQRGGKLGMMLQGVPSRQQRNAQSCQPCTQPSHVGSELMTDSFAIAVWDTICLPTR
jgi:hypothetical protein